MVLKQHKELWDQVFKIPGFYSEPFLMFGYQEMTYDMFINHGVDDFKHHLNLMGVDEVIVLDWDDPRADIHVDMGEPLPNNLKHERFKVVADVGCLEHVWNTKQCLENCLSMVELGGLYLLHTPVMGYYKHGIHTFNPDALRLMLISNGFQVLLDKYSTKLGQEIDQPEGDTLIWLVAKKIRENIDFVVPIDNHGKFEYKREKK